MLLRPKHNNNSSDDNLQSLHQHLPKSSHGFPRRRLRYILLACCFVAVLGIFVFAAAIAPLFWFKHGKLSYSSQLLKFTKNKLHLSSIPFTMNEDDQFFAKSSRILFHHFREDSNNNRNGKISSSALKPQKSTLETIFSFFKSWFVNNNEQDPSMQNKHNVFYSQNVVKKRNELTKFLESKANNEVMTSESGQKISIVVPVRGNFPVSEKFVDSLSKIIKSNNNVEIIFAVPSESRRTSLLQEIHNKSKEISNDEKKIRVVVAASSKKEKPRSATPLTILFTTALRNISAESKFLLFLSPFLEVLQPETFLDSLKDDLQQQQLDGKKNRRKEESSAEEELIENFYFQEMDKKHYQQVLNPKTNPQTLIDRRSGLFVIQDYFRGRWRELDFTSLEWDLDPAAKKKKKPKLTGTTQKAVEGDDEEEEDLTQIVLDDDDDDATYVRKLTSLLHKSQKLTLPPSPGIKKSGNFRTLRDRQVEHANKMLQHIEKKKTELLEEYQDELLSENPNNDQQHPPKQSQKSAFAAIQCLLLESTSTSVRNEVAKSTPFIVADAGWTVELNLPSASSTFAKQPISSNEDNSNHLFDNAPADDNIEMKNYRASSPRHDHFISISSRIFSESLFLGNRLTGDVIPASSVPRKVHALSPSCFFVETKSFLEAGAFFFDDDENSDNIPTEVDLIISDIDREMHDRKQKGAGFSQKNIEKRGNAKGNYRELVFYALFSCISSVEKIMDGMSIDQVRKAYVSLKRQVRASYSAIMTHILIYEELSGQTMNVAKVKNSLKTNKQFPNIILGKYSSLETGSIASFVQSNSKSITEEDLLNEIRIVEPDDNSNNNNNRDEDDEKIANDAPKQKQKQQQKQIERDPCMLLTSIEGKIHALEPSKTAINLEKVPSTTTAFDFQNEIQTTEARLQCATNRLILIGRFAKVVMKQQNRQWALGPEKMHELGIGWLASVRLKAFLEKREQEGEFNLGVSMKARAVYDFPSSALSLRDKFIFPSQFISQNTFGKKNFRQFFPWIPYFKSLHHSYDGFLESSTSATTIDDKNRISIPRPKFISRNQLLAKMKQHTKLLMTISSSPSLPSPISTGKTIYPKLTFIRVVWFAICCGCCGFSAEIAHFVKPLSQRVPVSLIPGSGCFCPGLPSGFSDLLTRSNLKVTQHDDDHTFFLAASSSQYSESNEEKTASLTENLIWISHTDPLSWIQKGFFARRRPRYVIARTMYEFSRIPESWDQWIGQVDEYWVPSLFCQRILEDMILSDEASKRRKSSIQKVNFSINDTESFVFYDSKVSALPVIHLIPEGIDTNFYSPFSHEKSLRFVSNRAFDERDEENKNNNTSSRWKRIYCNRDSFVELEKKKNMKTNESVEEVTRVEKNNPHFRTFLRGRQQKQQKQGANDTTMPRKPFEFFSNFKWESRKGWEVLFRAYWNAFHDRQEHEDTTLIILSYVFYPHGTPDHWSVFNETYIVNEIQKFLQDEQKRKQEDLWHLHSSSLSNKTFPLFKDLSEMPRFCVVAESVTEFELAQLFRGADAFVLPTRGEGWGLPTMQAMAMGLPVISTNWGGSVDFTTKETSFLIDIDGVEEVPKDSLYGWREGKKWAIPSVDHLEKLMRYVYENQEAAKEVGKKAREHIVKNFDDEVVVDIVDRRLQQISEFLGAAEILEMELDENK